MSNHKKPNILLVSIDSLRGDAISPVSINCHATPFIGELTNNATLFTNCFAQGIWTVPSHASIFTGSYPTEHRLHEESKISDGSISLGDCQTLFETFMKSGYRTGAFYRLGWLSSGDILRGIEQNIERTGNSSDPGIIPKISSIFDNTPMIKSIIRGIYRGSFCGHMADEPLIHNCANFINKDSNEPFFAFLHLNDAHWPYSPVRPYHTACTDYSPVDLFWNRAYTQSRMFPLDTDGYTPSDRQTKIMKDLYLGAVRQVDRHLRELFDRISDEVLENTLVIIFGDHGEAFGEHGELGHNDVIPEVCQVPLIMYDPSDTVSPEIVDDPVGLIQIYQTIGNVAGVELPSHSSQSLLSNQTDSVVFTHGLSNPTDEFLMGKYAAWRSESDYVIWDAIDDTYHHHGNTGGLELELQNHINELDHITPKSASEMEEYTKEQLKKLGYLG